MTGATTRKQRSLRVGYRLPLPRDPRRRVSHPCAPRPRAFLRLDPCLCDPTFVNDTIRREHSPPAPLRAAEARARLRARMP
jgi:hypothetical protein